MKNIKSESRLRESLRFVLWPGLLAVSLTITAFGFSGPFAMWYFSAAYIVPAILLYAFEQWMPHEEQWNENDGQTFANLAHTVMSKGTVQALLVFSAAIGIAAYITPMAATHSGWWPRSWPLWGQVTLGLVAAEFGLYWAHRLAHEFSVLWRFHAIHHSVTRLWIVNTGRFHFMDSAFKIVFGLGILLILGAPMEVVMWLSAITAFLGLLTHCNVDMRFGPLSYVFNTPEVHRWHHSLDLREGNKNYGENLVIWDLVFGTYFNDRSRRPPAVIGIPEEMPKEFVQQLFWPFRRP